MFLKKRKFYTLLDIRKQMLFIPIIFVITLALISILVIAFIFEFNKKNKIKFLIQEDTYKKTRLISEYINDIKADANANFDKSETLLDKTVTEISGYIKYKYETMDIKELKKLVQKNEKINDLNFVIFNKNNYKIIYGEETINYLMVITDTKIKLSTFQLYMLKNIEYIGDSNLIYWIDKDKRKIQLSFFRNIENTPWFIGAFSKIDDMQNSIRKALLNSIVQKSKYYDDSYFWFYDYNLNYVYNYYNKGQKLNSKFVLEQDIKNSSKNILKRYKRNRQNTILRDEGYNFSKYNFLVSLKSSSLSKKVSEIKFDYNLKLTLTILVVILITLFLVILSILFSKFINKIFHRYNKRLETKNIMYKKWKDRYELAIIASNDGLWDIDLKTKHIYFSKKWLEMFGYKDGNINTLDEWFELIHKEDKENVKRKFQEHLSGDTQHFICEYRIKNRQNKYKWILVRGKAFDDGHHKRMLMMSMDIEQRKQLVKELQYVDLLVEYGRIVIFKWKNDETLTVEYLSKSISAYGYDSNEFENEKIKYFDFVYKDDVEGLKKDIKTAIKKDDKSFTKFHRVSDKNGEIRWVFNRTIFLKDDFGNVTHLYGYINDITQMKLNEEELKLKIEDEVAKNIEKDRILVHQSKLAAMGEMLGNIAHQWRQPLNNISLLTHFIRDSYGKLSQDELNSIIKDTKVQIDYMSETIDDFRKFYQPNKDKIKFDIKESILSTIKIVDTQFEKCGIKLDILGESAEIINYKNEFQQVILNILNNAFDAAAIKNKKYSFSPKINILIQKQKNNSINIELSNNCGEVSSKVMDRMFEPYFTTKFENQGTGIGLYMAKTIIEKNMNGKISAKNIKDGISFIINLPL